MTIFDCCDSCDAVLTERELANEAASRHAFKQHLCFDCIDSIQADDAARRSPAGAVA